MTEDTSRVRLAEIAARVEAATGPDTALDLEIRDALGLEWKARHDRFTGSLDAALTLIPAEYRLGTLTELEGYGTRWAAKLFNRAKPGGLPSCGAATPALALVSAALRAKAAGDDDQQSER